MKKPLLVALFVTFTLVSSSQSMLFYNFRNTLDETNGKGPTLKVLGNEGVYVTDTLSEIGGSDKTVYRFEKNNGFQFDNKEAGGFIGESYTIELYFVFDELTSWKRVADWKKRKSDNGAYVYYGQLNFYPEIYSGTAPVFEGEYTYYVITRDGLSDVTKVYTDAEVMIEFTDSYDYAVIDADSVLNFFYDDLVVPNEASSGAVAMLKLYNYVLDSATIKDNWDDIGGTVFGINENKLSMVPVRVFPNPATDNITVDLANMGNKEDIEINVLNNAGTQLFATRINRGNKTYSIPLKGFASGLYLVRINTPSSYTNAKFIVR
ncbi:MAG TPA: T9SS type A sorting domain-containing protein [Bacteroidales bacterium]|nr:T9SS type A sorting domain-containing protein [Bacteroidales bacterium]